MIRQPRRRKLNTRDSGMLAVPGQKQELKRSNIPLSLPRRANHPWAPQPAKLRPIRGLFALGQWSLAILIIFRPVNKV